MVDVLLVYVEDICCIGLVVLDLVYVVCGCVDVYFEVGVKVWDIVVGVLLVCEVGGWVCDFKGVILVCMDSCGLEI